MAYAGKCDRCGGFYDLPFEHGAPIRARIVDVFDGVTDSKDLCPDCMKELHSFLGGVTAAKLAELVDAETLLFLTAYDKLTIGKGTPDEKSFDNVTASYLHGYIKAGHFPAKTTFPKVDASIRFVTADSSRKAVISNLDKAKLSLAGKSGTTITA